MVWEAVPLLRLEAHFPATQLASFSTCHPAAALRVLNLNHNQLYGPIPKDLARLNSLEQLLLGDNRCGAGEQAVARLRGAAAPPPPMLAVRRCDGGVATRSGPVPQLACSSHSLLCALQADGHGAHLPEHLPQPALRAARQKPV